MTKPLIRRVVALVALTMLGPSTAFAQTSITWVSGVGDDSNPCDRTDPCKTFAGAISKTDAGGTINVLTAGGFGAVVITKSITLNGLDGGAGIVVQGGNGITINAGVSDVVKLLHLQINGLSASLVGIRFNTGAALIVDDVLVQGFVSGIQTHVGRALINRSQITQNSGFGINVVAGTVTVENSVLTRNVVAAQAASPGILRLSNTDVYSNTNALGCGGGTLASAGNNHKGSNSGSTVPLCLPTVAITVF